MMKLSLCLCVILNFVISFIFFNISLYCINLFQFNCFSIIFLSLGFYFCYLFYLSCFSDYDFLCPISFEFSEDKTDTRIISGLSTEGLPLAVSWKYKLTSAPGPGLVNANVMVSTTRILTINNGAVMDVEL